MVTVKEVELWIEHMRPVYGAPLNWVKTALEGWFAAMREHGLHADGVVPVDEFIRGKGGKDPAG